MATVSTDSTYTFTVTGNRSLTAVFEAIIPTYTITATISPDGSGTVTGAGQYQEGATVTLVATPADGYEFSGWQEGGQTVSTNTTYSFTATEDREFTVSFSEKAPSRLPDGYTELEYIVALNCSFNSGVYLTQKTKTVASIYPLDSPTTDVRYFAYAFQSAATTAKRMNYFTTWQSTGVCCRMGQGAIYSNKVISSNTTPRKIEIVMDYYNKIASANSDSVTTDNNSWTITGNGPIIGILGTSDGSTGTLHARLYSCQIIQSGTTKRDFVPCKNPSGEIGLFDLIGKQFYSKSGTGTLTAGPAV